MTDLSVALARIAVEVGEPGARVRLDGLDQGTSPLPARLWARPGPHRVEATKDGFDAAEGRIEARPGEESRVVLRLSPRPPPPLPQPPPPEPPPPKLVGVVDDAPRGGELAAVARFDADRRLRGGAASVGVSYAPAAWLDLGAAAVIGPRNGARVWASLLWPRPTWRPFVAAGVPVLLLDRARPGVHAGAGVALDAGERIGLFGVVAVEHFPGAPPPYLRTVLVPSLGVRVRW